MPATTLSPGDGEILITGAAGFIGGEMAVRLATRGWSVTGFDLPARPAAHLAGAGVRLIEGDVTSEGDCARLFRECRPAAILHCAAAMGGSTPREEFMRVNLGGTRTLAKAAIATGCRRFVFVSSVTVHGMPPDPGITEETPRRSIGLPYADSKIATEAALLEHQGRGELDVTVLRPADVYGPRSGEWVVKLVEALRSGKMILIGGGSGLVNLTYVDNLTDAAEACLGRPDSSGQAYLVTDGNPVTWRRYLTDLASAASCSPPRVSIPTFLAVPMVAAMEAVFPLLGRKPPLGKLGLRLLTSRSAYRIDKARRDLRWEPAVAYEEGMRRVAEWIRRAIPPA